MNNIIDQILDEMSRIEEYFYENYGVILSESSPRIVQAPPEYREEGRDPNDEKSNRVVEASPEYKVSGDIVRKSNYLNRGPIKERRDIIAKGIKNFFNGSQLSKRKQNKVNAVLDSIKDGSSVVSMSSFNSNSDPKKASKKISKIYSAMKKRNKKLGNGEIVDAPPALRDYTNSRKTLQYDSAKTKTAAKNNYQRIW